MSNAMFQLIKGKKIAVVHEYQFGVLNKGYAFKIEEIPRMARKPAHYLELQQITTTDTEVILLSASPLTKVKCIAG